MKKNLIAVVLSLCVTSGFAASSPPKAIEADLRAGAGLLKDPDSAKFKDVVFSGGKDGAWNMCGFVNAKNSYGAYGGYQAFTGLAFTSDRKKTTFQVLGIGEAAQTVCEKEGLFKKPKDIADNIPFNWPPVPPSVIDQKL